MSGQIFISYSKSDKEFANRLADDLIAAGHKVWIDRSLQVGEHWEEVIERGLEESEEVVVIFSPNSVKSKWVQHEGSVAYALKKRMYPVLYQKVPSEDLPVWAEKYQYQSFVNVDYETAFETFCAVLTPPNPLQDLLDQQVNAYAQLGTLLGEAMFNLFEENRDKLKLSPNAQALFENSRKEIEARKQEIIDLQDQVKQSEERRRQFLKNGFVAVLFVLLIGFAVFNAFSQTNYGQSLPSLQDVSLQAIYDFMVSLIVSLGIPLVIVMFGIDFINDAGLSWREKQARKILAKSLLGAVLFYFFSLLFKGYPIWTGGELRNEIDSVVSTAWFYFVVISVIAFLVRREYQLPYGWRVLLVGFWGGTLLTIVLAQPVMFFAYDGYVPNLPFNLPFGNWVTWFSLVLAVLFLVGLGFLTAYWIRPPTKVRKLLMGMGTGLFAGIILYAMLGGTAAGLIAQKPIYDFAISQAGSGERLWEINFANAVSNTFWYIMLSYGITLLIPIIGVALTAILIPFNDRTRSTTGEKWEWPFINFISIPFVHLNLILSITFLSPLFGFTQNIYVDARESNPILYWGILSLLGIQYIFLVYSQVITIVWLFSQKFYADRIRLVSLAFLTGVIGFISLIFPDLNVQNLEISQTITKLIPMVLYLGILVSAYILFRRPPIAEEAVKASPKINWMESGLGAAIFSAGTGMPLLVSGLSLVLIAVVFIKDLVQVDAPALGIDKLLSTLSSVWPTISSLTVVLIFFNVALLLFLTYAVSRWPWKWVPKLWGRSENKPSPSDQEIDQVAP